MKANVIEKYKIREEINQKALNEALKNRIIELTGSYKGWRKIEKKHYAGCPAFSHLNCNSGDCDSSKKDEEDLGEFPF